MKLADAPIATESGHWYFPNGKPCYTIVGANGRERPTTLRDARKFGLVPSVTNIVRILDRPGLNRWMQEQLIMAALTLPRHEGEYDAEFLARVKFDAKEKARKAAERGAALHTDIEKAIQGRPHGHNRHVRAVADAMNEHGMNLYAGTTERSFAHPDGYGGKVDWNLGNDVADFKSKDSIEDGKELAWDEHAIQVASYAYGLGITTPRGFNIFVGIEDERVRVHEWSAEEMDRGRQMFLLLVKLWKLKHRIEALGA